MSEKDTKKMKKRLGYGIWAIAMVGIAAQGGWANDKHFKNAADKTNCKSIITQDGIRDCEAVQALKNAACNRPTSCELDKQEGWAKEYGDLLSWWDREGKNAPDNQYRQEKQAKMRDLREKLRIGKSAATAGITVAKECITARDNVQKWFENVAIPLTERTRNELNTIRRGLVDKFNETKDKREKAKDAYEKNPKDDGLRREWENARDANIKAGQDVSEFDNKYGPDITYYSDRLVSHYQSEKTNHDTPSKEADNRLAKCQKTENVSFSDSLPF